MNTELWHGRRVLVTGHTGFKGAWLSLWLESLGAEVFGLSLPPYDDQGAVTALHPGFAAETYCDIRDRRTTAAHFMTWRPEVVFHLAAQALVLAGYEDPIGTYETNVLGTVNVLSASVDAGVGEVVVVTSDKVYANDGSGRMFSETDPLGGTDPYSASKACADIAAQSWRSLAKSGDTAIGIARAGNVIGGGDTSQDRLLPDIWRAVQSGIPLQLRKPDAVRPWQFVLEPLRGYLLLAERLISDPAATPTAVNFGPTSASCRSVREVVELTLERIGRRTWTAVTASQPEEATLLSLDSALAERLLGWRPVLDLETAIDWTVGWWQESTSNGDLRALAERQVADYSALITEA